MIRLALTLFLATAGLASTETFTPVALCTFQPTCEDGDFLCEIARKKIFYNVRHYPTGDRWSLMDHRNNMETFVARSSSDVAVTYRGDEIGAHGEVIGWFELMINHSGHAQLLSEATINGKLWSSTISGKCDAARASQ